MSDSPTNRPGLIGIAFSVLVVGGALLRVYDIAGQVVADDEMHSLRSLKQYTASHVFTHFFGADISTPMALLQRVIGDQVGLSEVTTRLPVLAAGLSALVVLPALARRHFGAPVALVFAALVAISPQLIYYSRYGRPYMVCIVLVFCAVFSFVRWWSEGGWTSAATYVLAGASAVWFSVAVAPSVLTPIGWAAARTLIERRERGPRFLRLIWVGSSLGATLALVLAAPLCLSADVLFRKAGGGHPDLPALIWCASLFAGTWVPWLVAAFWLLALLGAGVALLQRKPLAGLLCSIPIVQGVLVYIAAPYLAQIPAVYARYTACVLPFVMLFVALSIGDLGRLVSGARGKTAMVAGSVGLVIALFLLGPIPRIYRMPNNFTNHAQFQFTYEVPTPIPKISPFYCWLGSQTSSFSILESPWYYDWQSNQFHRYQRVHRKGVLIGFEAPKGEPSVIENWPFGPPYAFKEFVAMEGLGERLRPDVRYALVHRDLKNEMSRAWMRAETPVRDVEPTLSRLEAQFGPPVYEDNFLSAFRIDGVREGLRMPVPTRCSAPD